MSEINQAEAVHYEAGELVFLSTVAFVAGYLEPLSLLLGDGTQREIRVRIKTSRSLGDGRFLGVATVLEGLAPDEELPEPSDHEAGRAAPRVPYRTRVVSQSIPNYQGLTLDCSLSGLQIQADGPLPVGETLDLSLDLGETGPPMVCHARVAWCRHHPEDGKYRSGLEFVAPDEALESAIAQAVSEKAGQEARGKAKVATSPHLRSQPLNEKLSPLQGVIQGCWMEERTLKVELLLAGGKPRTIPIPFTRAFRDRREQAGHQVVDLGISEAPGLARYRFLSPRNEVVLEVEAAPLHESEQPGRRIALGQEKKEPER
ncbi:MAG: PilZ domain-containing protein [Candidatus Eremiobacterota bacterium]